MDMSAVENPAAKKARTEASAEPLLELSNMTKRFGALTANDRISLSIPAGEIHAILGENGAGKSTLMKMIYGVLMPDAGSMHWKGEAVVLRNPAHARELGIGMVFQHFSLFESLTVAENISLAISKSVPALRREIATVSERFGLPVDPDAMVHSLSMGLRQRVEIIRCLLQEPRLIIMDEPTSVLPPSAIPTLFETVRRLAENGCAVLFISHKLEEIRSLCHTATIMRLGKIVATVDPMLESSASLAKLMIGRDIPHPTRSPAKPADAPALAVAGLSAKPDNPFATALHDIDLAVRPGEIVGIAGVSGNGQGELAAILSGERVLPRGDRDMIRLFGEPCGATHCGRRRAKGMAFVPEDRNGRGSIPEMSLRKNALLTAYAKDMVSRGFVRETKISEYAGQCIREMDVRCSGDEAEARSLSGGNLQKFIVGRELALKPKLVIASQPTWGVDIGAATAIRQRLVDMRDEGVAILILSDELEELIDTADRLHVLFRGRLSPSIPRQAMTDELIGSYMAGGFTEGGVPALAGEEE